MQSRGDQVRSYQFFLQRVISGLVAKESDPAELPFRRLGGAAIGSVMVTVLVLAGFGVYGLIAGGGATSWEDGQSIVQEKETGALLVYREDTLHPVENLVSAQLVLGGNARVTRVSARSLAGVPRGATIGIPGAPDSPPSADRLLTGGWTLCSQLVDDGRGGREAVSVLGVGLAATGGEPPGVDNPAVLVRPDPPGEDQPDEAAGGDELQLVWNRHRFAIEAPDAVLRALGAGPERALPVAPAWLNALPAGDPIGVPAVPERGGETTALGSQRHDPPVRQGQVVEAAGTHYLVRAESLLPLTPFEQLIVLNAPDTVEAYPDQEPEVRQVSLATAEVAAASGRTTTSPPQAQPPLVSLAAEDLRDAAMCAEFAPGEFAPTVRPGGRLPQAAAAAGTPRRTEHGTLLADRVVVSGGHGALVRAMSAPDAPGGSLHLVTDQGIRYALSDPAVVGMLGYPADRVVGMPGGLLDRIPTGPTLDPAAASQPVT